MSQRRSRSRRGEGEQLRTEILDAAQAILDETGTIDRVSTRAVAQRVGCSSPSIYLHFPDRAQLLFAVCERQFENLAVVLAAAAADEPDPIERLRALGRVYCRFAFEHPAQYRTMMMDVIAGAVYEKELDELRSELGFDLLFEAIDAGVAAGVLTDETPAQLLALHVWFVVHGLVSIVIAKPGIEWGDLDELVEGTLDRTVDGLRPRTAPPPARRRASHPKATKASTVTKAAKAPKASKATKATKTTKTTAV